jgi:diguanylate cyclase (GGDEF)-like protein
VFEFRIRHRDGRLLHTECQFTNLLAHAAVGAIVVNLRDVSERKRIEEQLVHQAFHDPMTGLANRPLFRDRVIHALTRRGNANRCLAVLFLDLDDFKIINDTFGHDAGDRVLQTISTRLLSALRESDTAARLGGDEFAVLLEDVANETDVSEIVADLLGVISAPLSLDGKEVSAECSIGIAVVNSTGSHSTAVDELLRNADAAMYQAKMADGNAFRHFRPGMQEAVVAQLELRADLKAAIAANELTLAYQPIFDLEVDEITGYEALLRWEHPVRGNVPPDTFIPVAEDSGLIVPLAHWVLERACDDAVAFQRDDPGPHERVLSVNVSAQQLARTELVGEVRSALRSSGLDPRCLMLEITESVLISDVQLAIKRLTALRKLGIRIALDDFGTGYSSLSYILQLPIDILKIDKRFIDSVDCDDRESRLTAAIIGLARTLDLRCVAEGIERPTQHQRLKELGCDYAQGVLLAQPMSADALQDLLTASAVPRLQLAPTGTDTRR